MSGWLRIAITTLLVSGVSLTQALASASNGRVVYSNNSTTPQVRTYTDSTNAFAAATATLAGAVPAFVVNQRCPKRNENLVGYVTTAGVLYIYRWNGTTWTNETSAAGGWGGTVTVGGNGVDGRRFDIVYETLSGDAMVVYSTNATGTAGNEMAYRTWNGTAWSAATNLNSARFAQAAAITWIKLAANPTSNEVLLVAEDTGTTTVNTSVLSTFSWNGTATWTEAAAALTTATTFYMVNTTGQLVQNEAFDVAFEALSGDPVVFFTTATSTTTGQQYYAERRAGTWQAAVSMATGRFPPLQAYTKADPTSNNIMFGWGRSASTTAYARLWDGTTNALGGVLGSTTTVAPAVEKRTIEGGWLSNGASKAFVVVAQNATAGTITYSYTVDNGATWTANSTFVSAPTPAAAYNWIDTDVNGDTMMVTLSSGATAGAVSLWAKRLVYGGGTTFTWTNADGGTAALGTVMTNATTQCFDFTYDVDFTPPVEGTLSVTAPPVFGAFVGNPLTFQETFTEAESSLKSCEYTLDNGVTWLAGVVGGTGPTFTCTASGVDISAAASVTLEMRATSQGGTSTPVNSATYTVDAAAPTTTDSYPGGAVSVDQSVTLAATDGTGAGVASTKWCQDTLNSCVPATVGTGPVSFTGAAGAKTVAYLRYFSTDNVGNAETVKSETIVIDKRNLTEPLAIQFPSVDVQTIIVNVLFGGDVNLSNSCTLTWGTDGVTYGNTATATRSGNVYAATIGSLSPGVTYYFKALFADGDTVTGTNPLLANATTPKVLLLHNSTSTGTKYGTWGTNFACDTCHVENAPNIKRIRAAVGGVGLTNAATPTPEVITGRTLSNTGKAGGATAGWATTANTNAVCDVCHARTSVFKNTTADTVSGVILSNGTPPHPNDLDCIKCHLHKDGFKVKAGCSDCHAAALTWNAEAYGTYQVGTLAPIIFAPNASVLRGEAYGGHLKALKTNSLAALTTKDAWDQQCMLCHDGHVKNPDRGVHIPNNTAVGIGYVRGYIALGGTAASGNTEAEICWNCHDQAANGVSEWGTNNKQTGSTNPTQYDYGDLYTDLTGTVKTSNWTTGLWRSGKGRTSTDPFWYKRGRIQSTHTANSAGVTTVAGSNYAMTETRDAVENIRCSYCHDVHNTAALYSGYTGDIDGKPYLRGSWFSNPYEEDGAPQAGQAYVSSTRFGAVPRGNGATTKRLGGFWIDINNVQPGTASRTADGTAAVNPTTGWTLAGSAGLCTKCHGTNVDTMDYTTGEGLWLAGNNGHANAVIGGTGAGAANIFENRGGTAGANINPLMHFNGTAGTGSGPGESTGIGYRNTAGNALKYTPNINPTGEGATNTTFNLNNWGTITLDDTTVNTQYHKFSCSKCHNPHASRLPKLMITNCLDTKHNTWDDSYQLHAGTSTINNGRSISNWSTAQNCHRLGGIANGTGPEPVDTGATAATQGTGTDYANRGWNVVTPWTTGPPQ